MLTLGSFRCRTLIVFWLIFAMVLEFFRLFMFDPKCHSCMIFPSQNSYLNRMRETCISHSDCILQWFFHISWTRLERAWCSEGLCTRSQNYCYLQHFDYFSVLRVFCRRVQPPCYFRGFNAIQVLGTIAQHIVFYDFYSGSVTFAICFSLALTP